MEHEYIEIQNIEIAYIEKNKEAPNTIFFLHGNSVSKRSWRNQYNSDLLSAHRLVAIDLPAHGDSGAAAIENYTLPGLAKLMCETIKRLANGKPYILTGISLGANIITEMLAYDINPVGLALAGSCIVGQNIGVDKFMKPNSHVGVVFMDNPADEDILAYANEISVSGAEDHVFIFSEDYKKVKSPFRSLLAQSINETNYSDEIALLQNKNLPILMIFGKDEKIIDQDYLDNTSLPLWNNKISKIEGASHFVNIDQPEAFNNLLKEFSADIFK